MPRIPSEPEVHVIPSDSDPELPSRHRERGRGDGSWKRPLKRCFDEITAPSRIAYYKKYTAFTNPGIEIENHGQISFPLAQNDVEAIKSVCCQAPRGHGHETVVDASDRSTWELDFARYELKNPHWSSFLDKVLRSIAIELGIKKLAAKPCKLFLHEPGSSFERRIHLEKEENMFGSLVICLPSKHEGADVHLSFRDEQHTLQTAPTSTYDLTALAWYSDVTHEVKELTSGYRLALTYKLLQLEGKQLSATHIWDQRVDLRFLLNSWQLSHPSTSKIVYGLSYKYAQFGVSFQKLKGRDRVIYDALNDLCSKCGLYLLLADVVHTKTEDAEYENGICYPYYDEDGDEGEEEAGEPYTVLTSVFTSNGDLVASDISIDENEIMGIDYKHRVPDSASDGEAEYDYSGPKGRYHDTAIVLIPRSRLMCLLQPSRGYNSYRQSNPVADRKAVKLVKMVADDLEKNKRDKKAVEEAAAFMKHALNRHIAYYAETAGILAKWSLTLGNNAIFVRVLDSPTLECVEKVDQVIVELFQKKFDGEEGEIDWNKWFGFLTVCSATKFEKIMLRITSQPLSSAAKQSLTTWFEAILDQKLEDQDSWDIEDCALIVLKLKRRLNDKEWMMEKYVEDPNFRRWVDFFEPAGDIANRFLPSIASQGSKALLLQLLHNIASERNSTFGERTTEIYKLILAKAGSRLLLNPNDTQLSVPARDPSGVTLNIHTYKFNRMIEEGYANDAKEETSKVLNATCARLASTQTAWMLNLQSSMITKNLLRPLAILLESYRIPPMPAVRQLYERCLRRVHESLPREPINDLRGWAHRPRGCNLHFLGGPQYRGGPQHPAIYGRGLQYGGGSCMDCQELDRFLTSPTDQVWQFTAADPRRRHIENQLRADHYAFDTIKRRTPYTLVVRKREPEVARVQRKYHADVQRVSQTLQPLRLDYVKKLLGEAEYERLIMLNQSPPIRREAITAEAPAVIMNQPPPVNRGAVPAAMPAVMPNQPAAIKRETQLAGPPSAMMNQPVAIKREVETQGMPPAILHQPVAVKREIGAQSVPTVMMNQPMANNGEAVVAAMPAVMPHQPVAIKREAQPAESPSVMVNQPVAIKREAEAQRFPPTILNQPGAIKREAEAGEMPDVKRPRY